jgi:hypothetical protein
MTQTPNACELAVLWKGEEDFAGLWEIAGALPRGTPNPETAAVNLVQELLGRGLLVLVWGDPNPREDWPLTDDEIAQVLREPSWWKWDVPFEGRQVWLYTTEGAHPFLYTDRG